MTTLEAIVEDNGAAVRLVLTPSASVASITRTDAQGTVVIRVPAGTFPRTTPVELVDWEASLGLPVTYNVTGAPAVTVTLGSELPWLVAPLRPSMSLPVDMVLDYSAPRAGLGIVHQIQDRPDPLVSLGRLSLRSGVLAVWVDTYARAREIENMIDRSGVVLFKQREHAGQDMYFTVNGTEPAKDTQDGWVLSIGYQEIARPSSPINAGAWTFGTVSTSFSSFANVSSGYNDFEGLSLNDQSGVI